MSHGVQMSEAELRDLPVMVLFLDAARAHGMGWQRARQMLRDGEFPCEVLRRGRVLVVRKADLVRSLGYPVAPIPAAAPAEAS
jgi:hypothetical protein